MLDYIYNLMGLIKQLKSPSL